MAGDTANGRAGNAADYTGGDPILDSLVSGSLSVVVALGNLTTILGIPRVITPGSIHDYPAGLNSVHGASASIKRQGNN